MNMIEADFLLNAIGITFVLQSIVVCNTSSSYLFEETECGAKDHLKETQSIDLGYMFTEEDMNLLTNRQSSPQFLPGLEALLQPYISFLVAKELEGAKIDNTSLKNFNVITQSFQHFFRSDYGSLTMGRVHSTNFKVIANPTVKLTGSLAITGLKLRFLQYNASVESGGYIGYNLVITMSLEVVYMLIFESRVGSAGTSAAITLHQELVGWGPVTFSDFTNCEIVEKQSDLNMGRMCGHHVLKEVTRWKGIDERVVTYVKPVVFNAIHCSMRKFMKIFVEMTLSYALILSY